MILLDTNVLSELTKANPASQVLAWISAQERSHLFTSTVSECEMLYGVRILPSGSRQQQLQSLIEAIFCEDFAGRVLSFDSQAAACFAELAANRRQMGLPIAQLDAMIAAIAVSRGAQLATRNVKDFEHVGLQLIDPWQY